MKIATPLLTLASLLAADGMQAATYTSINPGSRWLDTSGSHINAHGNCVVYHEGVYYWFGEDRTGYDSNGVSCYRSDDLYNWKRLGLVFKMSQAPDDDTKKCILERPKVIYNDTTGKWVMYIHWENGDDYGKARVCVAVADEIDGSYEFVATFRPNDHDSRDQTVFKDTDGRAYHFGSTDMNTNMNVALLAEDYLSTETNPLTEAKILNNLSYEAPAIFKVGDIYFGLFSGCTGWTPNPGHTALATEILGEWETGGNFAVDNGSATTYDSQSSYVLRVEGYTYAYIYMGDRWVSSDVGGKSEYVWLPLSVRSGWPVVRWYDSWTLSVFDNVDRYRRIAEPQEGAVVMLLDKYSDRWVSSSGNGFTIEDDNEAMNLSFRLHATGNPYVWKFQETTSGNFLQSQLGILTLSAEADTDYQHWELVLEEDGCYALRSVCDGKCLTVAGALQSAGTQVFMAKEGGSTAQSFGLYFDTTLSDWPKADMFSAGYRDDNRAKMKEQAAYSAESDDDSVQENSITRIVVDGGSEVVFLSSRAISIASTSCSWAAVAVIELASSREIFCGSYPLSNGTTNLVTLPDSIAPGAYAIAINLDARRVVGKLII